MDFFAKMRPDWGSRTPYFSTLLCAECAWRPEIRHRTIRDLTRYATTSYRRRFFERPWEPVNLSRCEGEVRCVSCLRGVPS